MKPDNEAKSLSVVTDEPVDEQVPGLGMYVA